MAAGASTAGRRRSSACMGGGDAPTGAEEAEVDAGFEFAFDNAAFSDKVLRIEVVGSSDDAPGSGADAASRKRRREEAEGAHIYSCLLFSNGMKESDERQATLRISDSEENAFMELLRFVYSGKLTPTTEPTLLVDILMVADKFEVISCMKLCGQRLIDLPMTPESAVLCLDLPSFISVRAALTEAAKKFLAERYKQFLSSKFQGELMRIPLPGIVAILSSNQPRVASEEAVYDFMLRWADWQYPNSEERRKILNSCLLPLVHQVCSRTNAIQIDQPSCIVDFTLKREQCSRLFPSGSIRSPTFHCAGHGFFLSVHCMVEHLFLVIRKLEDNGPVRETIYYKIELKTIPLLEFVTKYMYTATTESREPVGYKVPWSKFINSSWFIDGKLHLRVHIKIKPQT